MTNVNLNDLFTCSLTCHVFRPLPLMEEHSPPTRILNPLLSCTIPSSCFELLLILSIPDSSSQRSMFFGLPLFLFSSGFQVSVYPVMQFEDFCRVYPINFQRHFMISSSARCQFVFFHSKVMVTLYGQRTFSVQREQLFINTRTFLELVVVVLQDGNTSKLINNLHNKYI